jgi:hypothetical protein
MAAASSPGFFTQEEARATEAVAAAARGGVDDHGFRDGGQDVNEEEEERADLDDEDDVPEPTSTSTSKGRKKRKKNSPPTSRGSNGRAKKRSALPKLGRPFP